MSGDWIEHMNSGKGPRKGGLHRALGVPMGKTIPEKKIEKAANKPGRLGRMGRLAETLEGMHH